MLPFNHPLRQQLAIVLAASLLLGAAPLLMTTGRNLEYEYATMTAALLFLLGSHFWLVILGRTGSERLDTKSLLLFQLPGLATPMIAGLWLALGEHPCNPQEFGWWICIQLPQAYLGSWVMACLAYRARRAPKRSHGIVILQQLAVIITIICVLWFNPQKRGFFPILGFWHGPIYDDLILLDAGIVGTSCALVMFFLGILLLRSSRGGKSRLYPLGTAWALLLSAALTLGIVGGSASIGLGHGALQKQFKLYAQSADLQFYVQNPIDDSIAARHWLQAQIHLHHLSQTLDLSPQQPILIYLYQHERDKKLMFGGGETDVTDVVTPSIHISLGPEGRLHGTLRHELVHALLSFYAPFGLGFHPNMALTEGIAEALAPRSRRMSLDQAAAHIINSGKIIKVERLFSPLFWLESGPRAYSVAASFTKFLLEHYPARNFLTLFSGSSFKDAYGLAQEELIGNWRDQLDQAYQPQSHDLLAKELYADPGVFQDRCPHSRALNASTAADDPWLKHRRNAAWQGRRDFLAWATRVYPDHQGYQYESLVQTIRSSIEDKTTLTQIQAREISTTPNPVNSSEERAPRLWDLYRAVLLSDLACYLDQPQDQALSSSSLSQLSEQHLLPLILSTDIYLRRESQLSSQACKNLLMGITEADNPSFWYLLRRYLRDRQPLDYVQPMIKEAMAMAQSQRMDEEFFLEYTELYLQSLLARQQFREALTLLEQLQVLSVPPRLRDIFAIYREYANYGISLKDKANL